jgi:hypothetical protein
MALVLTPDVGVPITPEVSVLDLRDRVIAMFNTIEALEEEGLEVHDNAEDKDIATKLATAYAADPFEVSKQVNHTRAATLTPATLIQTRAILDEFGHAVAHHAAEIRHLVTNKLLLESENKDPKIRLRALELLGKISDVGLFTDRTEVTITHQSTDDLRRKLRVKFDRLLGRDNIVDAEITNG